MFSSIHQSQQFAKEKKVVSSFPSSFLVLSSLRQHSFGSKLDESQISSSFLNTSLPRIVVQSYHLTVAKFQQEYFSIEMQVFWPTHSKEHGYCTQNIVSTVQELLDQ